MFNAPSLGTVEPTHHLVVDVPFRIGLWITADDQVDVETVALGDCDGIDAGEECWFGLRPTLLHPDAGRGLLNSGSVSCLH